MMQLRFWKPDSGIFYNKCQICLNPDENEAEKELLVTYPEMNDKEFGNTEKKLAMRSKPSE